MKVAIYIDQGNTQIVLTPESDFEKQVVHGICREGLSKAFITRGEFYECRGGYFRESGNQDGLIIRLTGNEGRDNAIPSQAP